MFKKIISVTTAALVLASGMAIITAPTALATASSDATLDFSTSLFKGVSLPSSTAYNCIDCNGPTITQTTLTLTSAEAASTVATTSIAATDAGATVKVLKLASVTLPFTDTTFTNATAWNLTSAVYHNEIILVRVTAADGFTKKYYGWKINSASADATLSAITIKGVSVTNLGTPSATWSSAVAGAVTITPTQAASTQLPNIFAQTVPAMFPLQRKKFASGSNPSANDFMSAPNYSTGTLTDGDLIVIKSTAEDGSSFLYYRIEITVSASQQQNNGSSNSSSDAAAAAAALAAKVATAKATLVDSIKSGKPLTAADLNAADLTVASTKAAERVNAKIQTLPEAQRADLAKIKVIVERENFVEKVSSAATQFQVNTRDLVRVGLVAPDYVFKGAVVRSLLAADPVVLATIEQVEAAVKEAQAAVQARKDRLAAIIAKINGTK